jgi:hypothetical protein
MQIKSARRLTSTMLKISEKSSDKLYIAGWFIAQTINQLSFRLGLAAAEYLYVTGSARDYCRIGYGQDSTRN